MNRNAHFLEFIGTLHANCSPKVRRDVLSFGQIELFHMDGQRMASLSYQRSSVFSQWERIREFIMGEFDCSEDDVGCVDWSAHDAEDYAGKDAARDKISVRGKVVGYVG